MSEEPRKRLAYYKIEYPFHAIDATLYVYTQAVGKGEGAEEVQRVQLASGIVQYVVRFDTVSVEIRLQALDTHLCLLQVRMPTTDDQMLRDILDDIVQEHEKLIAQTNKAEILLSPARPHGGNPTPSEDTWAIEQLRIDASPERREEIRLEWNRRAQRNKKRKSLKDFNARFRKLVMMANKERS
jgi:hypothetical protein